MGGRARTGGPRKGERICNGVFHWERTGRRRTTSAQKRSVSVFQAKFVDAPPPAGRRSIGGRASILKPVRATAAEAGCNRRLWMFGGRNGIGGGGGTLRVTPGSLLYPRVCQLGRSVSGFKTGTKRMLCGGRAGGGGGG